MATIIHKFEVETDAPAYFPGSTVKGQAHLRTNSNVQCSEVSLGVLGVARCFIDSQPFPSCNQHVYYERKMTILGSKFKTENGVLEEDGVRFNTAATPDGGRVCIPFSKREKFLFQLIGCSSGGEEHILGCAKISPTSVIHHCRSRKQAEMPLTLDGVFPTAVMCFNAAWQLADSGDCQVMRLGEEAEHSRIVAFDISGVRLRKLSDTIRAMEYFYCRVTADSRTNETAGGDRVTIPAAANLVLPFAFKLPEKLPPSIDTEQGSSIRYCITCAVKGREVELPSAVCHFSVITSDTKPSPELLTPWTQSTVPRRPWFSCGFNGSPMVQMVTQLCQRVYMPGETVNVHVEGENLLHTPVAIRIDLVRAHQIRTSQNTNSFFTEFNLVPDVGVDKKKSFNFRWNFPFPLIAPSYKGTGEEFAPLTWDYLLVVSVKENSHVILTHSTTIMATVFPTAESTGDRILHAHPQKETRPGGQDRQKEIMVEGRGVPLQLAPDVHSTAERALNKAVEKGRCVDVSFIPVYSLTKALP